MCSLEQVQTSEFKASKGAGVVWEEAAFKRVQPRDEQARYDRAYKIQPDGMVGCLGVGSSM